MLIQRDVNLILSGGLGNQLFSICAGFSVAKIQNKGLRVWVPAAIVDKYKRSLWDEFDFSSVMRDLPKFSIRKDNTTLDSLSQKFIRARDAFTNNTISIQHRIILKDVDWLSQHRTSVLTGHFESLEVVELAETLGFPTKLKLQHESQQFKEEAERIKVENPISIHVRLGDYVTWQNGIHLLDEEYYVNALAKLCGSDSSRAVWVFSDDISRAKTIFGKFEKVRLIEKSLGLTPAEEMILMSRTDGLIASKSTFSWWAAYLSDFQTSVVSPHSGWQKTAWIRGA